VAVTFKPVASRPVGVARAQRDRLDLRTAVVAEEVAAIEAWQRVVADDVAADDRAVTLAVEGDEDGRACVWGDARLIAAVALPDAPAVVGARAGAGAREVDLLLEILPDVADDQIAGLAKQTGRPTRPRKPVATASARSCIPSASRRAAPSAAVTDLGPTLSRCAWRGGAAREVL
jgi:hypothetical protein